MKQKCLLNIFFDLDRYNISMNNLLLEAFQNKVTIRITPALFEEITLNHIFMIYNLVVYHKCKLSLPQSLGYDRNSNIGVRPCIRIYMLNTHKPDELMFLLLIEHVLYDFRNYGEKHIFSKKDEFNELLVRYNALMYPKIQYILKKLDIRPKLYELTMDECTELMISDLSTRTKSARKV